MVLNSNWQLFIDDVAAARATGFSRVIHHPRAMGVVIPADRPWETAGAGISFVERGRDGRFVAHYQAMWWNSGVDVGTMRDRAHQVSTSRALAVSEDGIHWTKPALRLADGPAGVDWSGRPFPNPVGTTRENNLGVPVIVLANLGRYGNVGDPEKQYAIRISPASQEILAMNVKSAQGYFARELPDFLNDPKWIEKLTDSGGEFNPRRHLLHFWDDLHGEWVAMEQGVVGHWLPSREIGRLASKDLVHWTGESVLYPDAGDSHAQNCYDEPMSLTPFYQDEVVFGLLSWFHSDRSHPHGGPRVADPTKPPGHPDHWPWCRKGTNEMRITLSRDGGKTWDRTSSRTAWIPHGTEEDSYDRLVIGGCPPVRVDDEDWFYTCVIDGDHLGIRNDAEGSAYYHDRLPKHQVGLYIQKHNRYVSLRAKNYREVLISKPFILDGDEIQLNVDAGRGQVRVGVASAEPFRMYDNTTPLQAPHLMETRLLEGLTFEDCEPIRVDRIEQPVKFKKSNPLKARRGKPVYLFFEMVDADLYGFRAV